MPIQSFRSHELQAPERKPLSLSTAERKPLSQAAGDPVDSFRRVMENALAEVNDLEKVGRRKAEDLAAGRSENVHDVMIALEKSRTALEYVVTVRNKVLEAYKEITRMQI